MRPSISIKRTHGLGNVIMLLPVIDYLVDEGWNVEVVTLRRWTDALNELRPTVRFTDTPRKLSIDLDEMTLNLKPSRSKTEEFASLLGIESFRMRETVIEIPGIWRRPYEKALGAIGLAPEAGHPGRQWPQSYSEQLAQLLVGSPLAIIGWESEPPLKSDFDFRGVPLEGLFGSISCLSSLVSMDSGAMHVARVLGIPTVAVFGGINPYFITSPHDKVLALQASLPCFPCNKNETCGGSHDCIKVISPNNVVTALGRAKSITHREIVTVEPAH